MEPHNKLYPGSFFKGRWRQSWKAEVIGQAIKKTFPIKTIDDVGCGIGDLVQWFNRNGFSAIGIEGSDAGKNHFVTPFVLIHDMRLPLPPRGFFKADLVTCFEVAEHIDPECADTFVDNLCLLSDLIVMSIAGPGQLGTHHVNLQPKAYWIMKFQKRNYRYMHLYTQTFVHFLACHKDGDHRLIRAIRNNAIVFMKEGS